MACLPSYWGSEQVWKFIRKPSILRFEFHGWKLLHRAWGSFKSWFKEVKVRVSVCKAAQLRLRFKVQQTYKSTPKAFAMNMICTRVVGTDYPWRCERSWRRLPSITGRSMVGIRGHRTLLYFGIGALFWRLLHQYIGICTNTNVAGLLLYRF